MRTMVLMMKKLAASPVKAEKSAGGEENDDQGIAELGQKLKDQGPFSLGMDQVGTEMDQTSSGLRAAQSLRAGIQVLHERRNRKLPEGGLSLGSGYNRHERFLQRVALQTLSSGSNYDYARRNSAIDARANPPLMSGEMLISSTVNPTRSTS